MGYVNSIQEYWTAEFEANGLAYEPAETVLFTESVSTGCGVASSAVGPFYCPLDDRVYLDLGFFAVLEQQFGASGGPFAQAYVVAHEYGHHAQDLLGILAESGTGPAGDDSVSVRTELMADCFAGRWARGAAATDVIAQVTNADIAEALDAAAAVGDDRIQERVQGQVTPETWTHGSSSERVGWFTTGYEATNLEECDTFTASTL